MKIASDRRYRYPVPPEAVWASMARVTDYPTWWPWLEQFDGRRLAPGEVWSCAVRAPVPWVVHFRLTIGDVVEGRHVSADLDGDIRGEADIELTPDGGATVVRLRAALAPRRRGLLAAATLARPLVRFGHDWVLDTGARQFGAHLPVPVTPR